MFDFDGEHYYLVHTGIDMYHNYKEDIKLFGEMEKCYGFIYVDRDNIGNGSLRRTKKASLNFRLVFFII